MKRVIFQIIILIVTVTLFIGCKTLSSSNSQSLNDNFNSEYLHFQIDSLKSELNKFNYNFEPGKVYTRCSIEPVFETIKSKEKYFVYTGKTPKQEGVSEIHIFVKPAFTIWVKKKASEICTVHSKLDDQTCENWHLKEIPPVYKNIYIVNDTNKIKEYEFINIDSVKIIKKSYLTDFREVSCPTIFVSNLVGKVQNSLREKGYSLHGAKENSMDEITKNAIMEYQRKNGLSVGKLDFNTLKSLGVK